MTLIRFCIAVTALHAVTWIYVLLDAHGAIGYDQRYTLAQEVHRQTRIKFSDRRLMMSSVPEVCYPDFDDSFFNVDGRLYVCAIPTTWERKP